MEPTAEPECRRLRRATAARLKCRSENGLWPRPYCLSGSWDGRLAPTTSTTFWRAVAFVIWELRVQHPVINLRVLRHRGFAAGTIFGTTLGFGLYGGMFILPVFLQNIRGLTAESCWE